MVTFSTREHGILLRREDGIWNWKGRMEVLDWQITSLSIIKIGIINPCGALTKTQT